MPESTDPTNTAIAQRIQEKFDAYLLGLIFTVLGLSIQTAKFGASPTVDAFEIISWLLFLVAGLAGLSRLEWTPEVYRLYGIQDQKEGEKRAVQKAKLEGMQQVYVAPLGKSVPADQYIAEAAASVETIKGRIEPLIQRSAKKYRVMKYGFALGLLALMIARALGPLKGIIHAWAPH